MCQVPKCPLPQPHPHPRPPPRTRPHASTVGVVVVVPGPSCCRWEDCRSWLALVVTDDPRVTVVWIREMPWKTWLLYPHPLPDTNPANVPSRPTTTPTHVPTPALPPRRSSDLRPPPPSLKSLSAGMRTVGRACHRSHALLCSPSLTSSRQSVTIPHSHTDTSTNTIITTTHGRNHEIRTKNNDNFLGVGN